ncbi:Hypothetical predicted protein [Cloeon dipterum]|uniref:CDK5 regulatory subunit-associated protein 3 n=1 Tax=Cloeon dipterum TaxID=197152 RepID=A0A8S1C0A0_9INSE|nr:Hypothetical predicted protein [Cloeon dipterum]
MQDLPIEINAGKLLEWLISRHHCKRDWSDRLADVRAKISAALQDMPQHDGLVKLLDGSYLDYWGCKGVIDVLRETEKDSKNFLGQYGSRRMKDWQEIVKSYEKDNLFLAEAAHRLARNVNFEVPYNKKLAAKALQMQDEADRREADSIKAAASLRAEYVTQCKALGVPGTHLKQELIQLSSQLPELLSKAALLAADTLPAQKHYEQTAAVMLDAEIKVQTPLLAKLGKKGDLTVYEWKNGQPPVKIEQEEIKFEIKEEDAVDEIDFGDEVDFGDGEIDFGIEVADSGVENGVIEEIKTPEEPAASAEDGVARGKDALSVLDFPDTRNQVLDELTELEAFLQARLTQGEGVVGLTQIEGLSESTLTKMIGSVAAMKDAITEKKTQHLHNIKHSIRYADQLAEQLSQKLSLEARMQARATLAAEQRSEAVAEAARLGPATQTLIQQTRRLQSQVEGELSKKYSGRPVMLTGGAGVLTA